MKFLKGLLMGIAKGFGMAMLLGIVIIGLFLGTKTANYIRRGFGLQEALEWTMSEVKDQIPEAEEDPYREKEMGYSINQHVDVVPCVDLT